MANISMLAVCRYAEVVDGNLYALGLGWNWCWNPSPPLVVVARIETPEWRLAHGTLSWTLTLEDADAHQVDTPLKVEAEHIVAPATPDGTYPGVEVPIWSLFRVGSMDLEPARYQWRVTVDDEAATYAFAVVEPPR